ncbi:MAG TPA: AarF/ABC1/UbiB kinase family protein [Planctomycetota bacterium]|nr:AarF/ABC1/UbiB kinase family protein [Planctomycetota bacterium]
MADRSIPTSAPGRLARIGVMGAGVLGRNAIARLRKIGAGEERCRAIDLETHEANAVRIFDAMTRMKGAFMKLGQLLSSQAHALPEPYLRRLAGLQWEAPPMHGTLMRMQFRNELGKEPEEVFAEFEREAFAAASLGQVHRARLKSGEPVAVKIQYPGIDRSIESDFANLKAMLSTIRLSREQYGEVWEAVEEVRTHFRREVDYVREAETIGEFRRLLRDRDDVRIPRVYPGVSTRRVLVMEYLEGRHLRDYLRTKPSQAERDDVATRLLDLFFRQALEFALLHADPHPGNYLFLEGGRIGLLDFGCSKRFDRAFVEQHKELFRIPVGDVEALERHARFYDPADPRRDEKRAALADMQRTDIAKYHEDRAFDFGNTGHLREVIGGLQRLVRLGLTTPGFALYVRAKIGLYTLFHQLGARVNCHKVLRPYV